MTAEQREYAETVLQCGEALLTIIDDILDFSQIEANKLDLEHSDFDLRAMVEEVLALVAERSSSKGLELGYLLQADLPTWVAGDPDVCAKCSRILWAMRSSSPTAVKWWSISPWAKKPPPTPSSILR